MTSTLYSLMNDVTEAKKELDRVWASFRVEFERNYPVPTEPGALRLVGHNLELLNVKKQKLADWVLVNGMDKEN